MIFFIRNLESIFNFFKIQINIQQVNVKSILMNNQQNKKILFEIIKRFDSTFDEEDMRKCIKCLSHSASAMLIYMLSESMEFKRRQLKNFGKSIIQAMKKHNQFATWMGASFKIAWIKYTTADFFEVEKEDLKKILNLGIDQEFDDNLKNFFSRIRRQCQIQKFYDQENINRFSEAIQRLQQYKYLVQRFPYNISQQDTEAQSTSQINEANQKLSQMQKMLIRMQGSILDELILKNLIQSFISIKPQTGLKAQYSNSNFNSFKEQLLKILKQFGLESAQIRDQMGMDLNQNQTYYDKIILVRNKIHPVFVPELMELIRKNSQAKDIIKDKDAIVMLGVTGAGKTTCVQMLLGYQLMLKKRNNQMTTLVPIGGLKPQHRQFIAKASSASITKYASAIKLKLPQEYEQLGQIYLTDTPGFFDTQGTIVEIANSLSTIRVLQAANSIRFIFLVNEKNWGTRCQGIRQLAKIIARLFTKYEKNEKSKAIFLLNRFNQDQLKQIPAQMEDLIKNLNSEQKANKYFYSIINHFSCLFNQVKKRSEKRKESFQKAIQDHPQLVLMNPTNYDIQQIYKKILDQGRSLTNPKQTLANILNEKVRLSLVNQVNVLYRITQHCFNTEKIDAALYYFSSLNNLAKQTRQVNDVAQAKQKIQILLSKLKQKYEKMLHIFSINIQNKVLSLRVDKTTISQTLKLKKELERLRCYYKRIPELQDYDKTQQINLLIKQTSQKLCQKAGSGLTKELIQTIFLYSEQFDQELSRQFVTSTKQKKKSIEDNILEQIRLENYSTLENALFEWDELYQLIKDIQNINSQFNIWKSKLKQKVESRMASFRQIITDLKGQVQVKPFRESDLQLIKRSIQIFQSCQIFQRQELKILTQYRKETLTSARQIARKYILEIRKLINSDGDQISKQKSVQTVIYSKQNVKKMMTIKEIENELSNQLNTELMNLQRLMHTKKIYLEEQLEKINPEQREHQQWPSLKNIHRTIQTMKKLVILCQDQQKISCTNILNSSSEKVVNGLNIFLDQIQSTNYSLETSQFTVTRILEIYKTISFLCAQEENNMQIQINRLSQMQEDQIMKVCKRIKQQIAKQIKLIVNDINEEIRAKEAKLNLNECQENIEEIGEWMNMFIKANQFFVSVRLTSFKPNEVSKEINQSKKQCENCIKKSFNALKKAIFVILQDINHNISNSDISIVFQRQKVYKFFRLRNILVRFLKTENKQKTSTTSILGLLNNNGIDLEEIQDEIQKKLQNLRSELQKYFKNSIFNGNNIPNCYKIIGICQSLQYLDGCIKEESMKFCKILTEFQEQANVKTNSFNQRPDDLIREDSIDFVKFKSMYCYLKKFGPNSLQEEKLKEMMERTRFVIRKKQQNLVKKIKIGIKSVDNQKQFEDIYISIQQLFNNVRQINGIVDQSQKISIQKAILQKVEKTMVKIIQGYQQKLQRCIDQGSTGDSAAEEYIERIRYIEESCDELQLQQYGKQLKEKQCKEMYENKNIWAYWQKRCLEIKNSRKKKYLTEQLQPNMLDNNFRIQFEKFNLNEKDQIQNSLYNQYQNIFQKVIAKLEEKSISQLERQMNSINSTLTYLPNTFKEKIKKLSNEKMQTLKRKSNIILSQAETIFNSKDALRLIKEQKRDHIKKIYLNMAKSQFQSRVSYLKKQQNIDDIKRMLRQTFIQTVQNQSLDEENAMYYKNIYQKYLKQVVVHIQQEFIQKGLIRLCKLLDQHNQIKGDDLQRLEYIKKQASKIKQLLQYINYKKKVLQCFDTIKLQNKLRQCLNNQIKKTKSNRDGRENSITLEMIIQRPTQFVIWNQRRCSLTVLIESFKSFDAEINSIYIEFVEKMNQVNKQVLKIKQVIASMIQSLNGKKIYSQTMKSYSKEQRRKFFQTLQNQISIITNIQKIDKEVFKEGYSQFRSKFCQSIKRQIEKGIQRSLTQCIKGFEDSALQFNKDINLTISIINILQHNCFTFVSIDENIIRSFFKGIKERFDSKFGELDQCFEEIKNSKDKTFQKINQSAQKRNKQKQKFACNKKKQIEDKIQQTKKSFKDKIQKENDQILKKKYKLSLEHQLNQYQNQFQNEVKQNESKISKQLQQETKKDFRSLSSLIEKYCQIFTIIYKANLEIDFERQNNKSKLDSKMNINIKSLGKRLLNQFFKVFEQKNNTYSKMLTSSYQIFKKHMAIKWEAKVKGNGIDYVLKNINVDQKRKEKLRQIFDSYTIEFNKWTKQYQNIPTQGTKSNLLDSIKNEAKCLYKYYHESGPISKPQKLLAGIFALWTIINSQVQDFVVQFYYQPHPAQVISIFLCLSFIPDDDPRQLYSKMAQIGTGQGKSVVLAGISSYLALCGFEVNSVCFSAYLSQRDRQTFANLFEMLQVNKKITYGTFDQVCESLLNKKTQESQGFRSEIKKLLQSQQPHLFQKISSYLYSWGKSLLTLKSSKNAKNKKIMLIDEVDVFFDPTLFGSLYCPDVEITSDEVKKLMKSVWEKFKQNKQITDEDIINNDEFERVANKYEKIQKLLKEQVKGMILGCRESGHNYIIQNDQIMYKDQDGISNKINFGFKTLFAYFKEHDKQRITFASLERALKISIIIAEFSYALLPKYFKSIIGVTGTYETMSQFKKSYMQREYSVKQVHIIPSVYGNEHRRLINKAKIVPPEKHHEQIINQIKQVHKTGRPILVFFKSASEMDNFFQSPAYEQLQKQTTFLNETHRADDRDLRLKKTCNRGNITFMTNSFGRGTDFRVYDQSIYSIGHGGLHVIQTFLSVDSSQQTQIQGRTARQGSPGTYSLIIQNQDLELLNMNPQQINNFQNQLKKSRLIYQQQQSKQTITKLNQANAKHQKCIQVYLTEQTKESQILEYIGKLNSYPAIKKRTCKTIIAVDATGSMSSVLQQLLIILGEVVNDIVQITSKFSQTSSSHIQILVYRNYSCTHQTLMQCTPFQTQALGLQNFLRGVRPLGGLGNQALEIAYNHIDKTPNVDQVILIGDAAANEYSQTITNRTKFGQKYWNDNGIPFLHAEEELNKIKAKKIPIHSFYIAADRYFKRVSSETNGLAQKFDVYASNASQRLSKFIVERILQKTASDSGQAEVMKVEYNRKRHSQ